MATTGELFAGSGGSVDRSGNNAWTDPGNITADDAAEAFADVPTDYLVATNFGASIPSGATIDGITVRVHATEIGTGSSNFIPQLVSDGTPTLIGSAKSAVTIGSNPHVSGGSSDVWGATLTPAIVSSSGFGVAIWSTDSFGGNEIQVDYITIEIHYTEGGPPIPTGSADPGDFFFVMRDED